VIEMSDGLPDGPALPATLQTIGWVTRPTALLERCRRRYGSRFTLRLLGAGPIVVLSDPRDLREVLTAPPDVLHPGEGAKVIEPVVGPSSVIVLDEDRHLEQRRLMLPPFHGEALRRATGLIEDFCEREVESWPVGEPVALHPRLQRVTLEIILRVVFGLEAGEELAELKEALTVMLESGTGPWAAFLSLPALASTPPARRRDARLADADRLVLELVDRRRAEGRDGEDVLSLLLAARHEDGSPMSDGELRDELVTALVAGHETTASQLAWAFSMLAEAPDFAAGLGEELEGGRGEELLTSTLQELMRMRPVLPNAEPRVVAKPVRIGPFLYPRGTTLFPSSYLIQHDPEIYPEPYRFRPERFVETPPGTYTWLPFGAGRRRCVGASFAMLEMQTLMRAALRRFAIAPTGVERAARRGITITPSRQATVVLSRRAARGVPAASRLAVAA